MELDTVITGLKLLTALLLLCVTFLVVLPYFVKPEEFFVKRLRPNNNHRLTHTQLLVRAFGGAGLLSAGLYSLATVLVLSLVMDIAWAWLIVTLGGGMVVSTGHYIRFRLDRYRKLAPDERHSMKDGDAGVFVRRKVSAGNQRRPCDKHLWFKKILVRPPETPDCRSGCSDRFDDFRGLVVARLRRIHHARRSECVRRGFFVSRQASIRYRRPLPRGPTSVTVAGDGCRRASQGGCLFPTLFPRWPGLRWRHR